MVYFPRAALLGILAMALPRAMGDGGLFRVGQLDDGRTECMPAAERELLRERITSYLQSNPQHSDRAAARYLFWPQGCTLDQDSAITHFFDNDPAVGSLLDYNCTTITYDGHNGSDASTRSVAEFEIGMPVFAAADGVVVDSNDGEPDYIGVAPPGAYPNYVILDNGGGRFSFYWHLKQGSVLVSTNQSVKAGQQMAMTGSSGGAGNPHLHFGNTDAGQFAVSTDPFAGACGAAQSAWESQPPLSLTPTLIDFGIAWEDPATIEPWPTAFPRTGQIATTDTGVTFWIIANNLPADSTWRVRIQRPNGTTAIDSGDYPWFNDFHYRWFWTTWRYDHPQFHAITGVWHLLFDINGVTLANAPFTIRPMRTSTFNTAPLPVTVQFDPPVPTAEDPVFARVSTPGGIDDADYDVVRYHYVWTVDGAVIRDVTVAGMADAIPHSVATAGSTLRCTVTPNDGAHDGPSAFVETVIPGGCTPDLNGSGTVDLSDLGALLAHYGTTSATCAEGDIDGDGDVDLSDLGALLAAYGT